MNGVSLRQLKYCKSNVHQEAVFKSMAQARVTKQWLQKQFQSSGIQAEPAALARLAEVLDQSDDAEHFLHSLLDDIETSKSLHALEILCLLIGVADLHLSPSGEQMIREGKLR